MVSKNIHIKEEPFSFDILDDKNRDSQLFMMYVGWPNQYNFNLASWISKENGSQNIHIKEVPFYFEVSDVKLKEKINRDYVGWTTQHLLIISILNFKRKWV